MTNQDSRDSVLKLMQEKNKIEDEINNLTTILTKNGVGMLDPLVDTEGFPLSHIDIYQNDHQNIMKQIENGLHEYYSSSKDINVNRNVRENISSTSYTTQQYKDPFAKVTIVTEGSPAAYAGLEEGDLIIEFGSLNATNFTNIVDISNVVKHSEGHQLKLKLKRNERYIVTHLLPKRWVGSGLLGCNIIALR